MEGIQDSRELNSKVFSPNFHSIRKSIAADDNNQVTDFWTIKDYFD